MSVRETEKLVRSYLKKNENKKEKQEKEDYSQIQSTSSSLMMTKRLSRSTLTNVINAQKNWRW